MTEPSVGPPGSGAPDARVTRRQLMVGIAGATAGVAIGAVAGWAIRDSREDPWPGEVVLGDAGELLAEIEETNGPLVRPDEWSPIIAVISWDPSLPRALDVYPQIDHAILDDHDGLMVLSLRDPHLGCRIQWCTSSAWFENPCHGERYNRWGEWASGPAPRGMDRYASRVDEGRLVANLAHPVIGPARDARVLDQDPDGPHCVE